MADISLKDLYKWCSISAGEPENHPELKTRLRIVPDSESLGALMVSPEMILSDVQALAGEIQEERALREMPLMPVRSWKLTAAIIFRVYREASETSRLSAFSGESNFLYKDFHPSSRSITLSA